jgi:serine/threonine-protein kinase
VIAPHVLERARRRVGTVVRRRYHVDAVLGVGGTGAVFAATHRDGDRVALKVLHPELSVLPEVRARFLREGHAANRVGHPGVVRVLDDDGADETAEVLLVMELLEGESVHARVERAGGRLPLPEVLALADELLDVLGAAHGRGIVHRDIKPENLFLTRKGQLKVLDFGIARLLDGSGATSTGTVLGTPGFMPPEQASGRVRDIGPAADLWAAAAVVFLLLGGEGPHAARTPGALLVMAATQQVRPLATVERGVPEAVARVVDRALAFDPRERWASAPEMQAALRDAVRGIAPSRSPAPASAAPTLVDEESPTSAHER